MITHNKEEGVIADDAIRYVLIRPDVLMGVAHQLPVDQASIFLDALEKSAFENSRDSFAHYRRSGRFGYADFLLRTAEVAATLGWGAWTIHKISPSASRVEVRNSPFAAGFGRSEAPVCAPIRGVLRAIALIGYGDSAAVRETCCASQEGVNVCHFHIQVD
jgi:uncharacterized protein